VRIDGAAFEMNRSLYITSSSYSGSTLLSFLLNTHPEIFTVGEMDGWNYGEDETFECSCGRILCECPFFRRVARAFADEGLPFDYRDFGTMYRLARSARFNRYLLGSLPASSSTRARIPIGCATCDGSTVWSCSCCTWCATRAASCCPIAS
jgi:hypothetical protein